VFGIICRPFAFLLGVNWQEALQIGSLIGQKIAINEFVAFSSLGDMILKNQLSPYAIFVSTFVLASFANFSSVGIMSGVVKSLAPNKSEELSKIIMKCLFGAILASFITASVAGLYFIG
jgi:CNT family concentrative nucleoside transporter